MCIICTNEYTGMTEIDCLGCPSGSCWIIHCFQETPFHADVFTFYATNMEARWTVFTLRGACPEQGEGLRAGCSGAAFGFKHEGG